MFPDSNVAKNFSCGQNKCSYLINFGLRPYYSELLSDTLKNEVDFFVIMFDESHNSVLEKKQMDIHLRFWDKSTNAMVT